MKLRVAGIAALAFSLVASPALADSFFLANVINAGAEQRATQVIGELLKTAVSESGQHHVTENAAKADFTLQAKIIQLGSSFIISLDKRKGGEIVFSSQLKAQNLDEMDVVLGRLVRAVIEQKRVKENAEVGETTELEEKNQLRSRDVQGRWYLAFGPSGGAGTGNKNMFGNVSMGRFWDIDDFTVTTQFSFTGSLKNENASMTELGLGSEYLFNRTDISPYLGADLNWAWVHVALHTDPNHNSQDLTGFSVGMLGGYRFFRTSKVNLDVNLRYAVCSTGAKTVTCQATLHFELASYFKKQVAFVKCSFRRPKWTDVNF